MLGSFSSSSPSAPDPTPPLQPKRRHLISRRSCLLGLLGLGGSTAIAGAGGLGYTFAWEPFALRVETTELTLFGHRPDLKRRPLRLLHLTDLHASEYVPFDYLERAIDRALELDPDLICLTGDYITTGLPDPERYTKILSSLSRAAPAFACLGNHDGGSWSASGHGLNSPESVVSLLEQAGIHVLRNRSTLCRVRQNSVTLQIAGTDDLWNASFDVESAFAQVDPASEAPVILLLHNPDGKAWVKHKPWHLMLSGHTHGGQLVVPILGLRPFLPVEDRSMTEGLYHWEERLIYISRGIGNVWGGRFNCPPEISLHLIS